MPAPHERIALFGGTFDPIHRGHLQLAMEAHEAFDLNRVIFVPCQVSPFKTDAHPSFGAADRAQMIRESLAEIDPDGAWAEVSEIELERPPPSYSWQTAQHFAPMAKELFWILGTDQWEQIDRWAEADILRETLTFIVVTRDDTPVRDRSGWRFHALPFHHPASSSAIREGRHEVDWLPEPVAAAMRDQS